jgi:hypothetical protein
VTTPEVEDRTERWIALGRRIVNGKQRWLWVRESAPDETPWVFQKTKGTPGCIYEVHPTYDADGDVAGLKGVAVKWVGELPVDDPFRVLAVAEQHEADRRLAQLSMEKSSTRQKPLETAINELREAIFKQVGSHNQNAVRSYIVDQLWSRPTR